MRSRLLFLFVLFFLFFRRCFLADANFKANLAPTSSPAPVLPLTVKSHATTRPCVRLILHFCIKSLSHLTGEIPPALEIALMICALDVNATIELSTETSDSESRPNETSTRNESKEPRSLRKAASMADVTPRMNSPPAARRMGFTQKISRKFRREKPAPAPSNARGARTFKAVGDPTEVALLVAAYKAGMPPEKWCVLL